MAWPVIDRRTPVVPESPEPVLSEAIRDKIRSFLPRYEMKRAALLPALHVVQDALGHVSHKAMVEIAELLDLPPSAVLDTMSFYTHFWDHAKGGKVIVACRSLSCQIMGADKTLAAIKQELGIDEHGTTADGKYSLLTEECLAACDHAPCLLINERLHKCVKAEDVAKLLKDPDNDKLSMPRSDLFDAPAASASAADEVLGRTSDIAEMRDA